MPGIRGLDAAVPNCLVRIDDGRGLKKKRAARVSQPAGHLDYLHTSLALTPIVRRLHGTHGKYAEAYCSVPLEDYRKMFHEYRGG